MQPAHKGIMTLEMAMKIRPQIFRDSFRKSGMSSDAVPIWWWNFKDKDASDCSAEQTQGHTPARYFVRLQSAASLPFISHQAHRPHWLEDLFYFPMYKGFDVLVASAPKGFSHY